MARTIGWVDPDAVAQETKKVEQAEKSAPAVLDEEPKAEKPKKTTTKKSTSKK